MQPLCTSQVSVNTQTHSGEAAAIRCKRWSCPSCAEANRKRVIAIAREGKPRALLTLTVSSEHYDTPDAAAEALKHGLRMLRLRLKRHTKLENFEFIAVFEKHKSGFPHLHLLIKGKYIPWQWLRAAWEAITGSIHVDIRKINSTGMAALYAAKYIGKDLSAFAHCKRWWRSHGYSEPKAESYEDDRPHARWTRYQIDFGPMLFNLRMVGYEVERTGRNRISWHWPPEAGPPPGWLWSATAGKRQ
jgi:hypothetical protein